MCMCICIVQEYSIILLAYGSDRYINYAKRVSPRCPRDLIAFFLWLTSSPPSSCLAQNGTKTPHSFFGTLCPSTDFLATKQMSNAPSKCLTTNKKNLQASIPFAAALPVPAPVSHSTPIPAPSLCRFLYVVMLPLHLVLVVSSSPAIV
jgi:hypothetical protein